MIKSLKKYIRKKVIYLYENRVNNFFFKQEGFCPCCEKETSFIARNNWLRDHFLCQNCGSLPRERALMHTIKKYYPNWKELNIHESSPGNRGHSITLKRNCRNYSTSQFFSNDGLGTLVSGFRNEDLEKLTFPDNSFDLFITSDVMEHVYEPDKAFSEIYRVLKPGGAHIFSVPLINKHQKTKRWATKGKDGEPVFLYEPEWHGNPIDKKGSPVTFHWGYDIVNYINEATNSDGSFIEYINDLNYGIRAEYIEIVVTRKS